MTDRKAFSRACARIAGSVLSLLLMIPALAAADGMALTYGDTSSAELLRVSEQRAVIAHKDGIQRMFIAINLKAPPWSDDPSRAAVWIYPVPGTPDRADVNVTDNLPTVRGRDIRDNLELMLRRGQDLALGTQPHFNHFVFETDIWGHPGTRKWQVELGYCSRRTTRRSVT
ncbi:hypothetical protein ACFL2Q_15130 [Thermodesulfobacteriota bacterium]